MLLCLMQATAFNKGEGLKVVATEKDGIKVLRIKKEINDDTEHNTPSPVTGECDSFTYHSSMFENSA